MAAMDLRGILPPGASDILSSDELRFLGEAGMEAAVLGQLDLADAILLPLKLLRPGHACSYLGMAAARLRTGRPKAAARLLEDLVVDDPGEQAIVMAWHGLALQLAGHAAASKKRLEQAALLDGTGATMAKTLLGLGDGAQTVY